MDELMFSTWKSFKLCNRFYKTEVIKSNSLFSKLISYGCFVCVSGILLVLLNLRISTTKIDLIEYSPGILWWQIVVVEIIPKRIAHVPPPSSFYASPSKGGGLCHSAFCHLAARFTFRACRDKNCQGINSDKWKKLRPCPKFQLSVTCFFQDYPTTQWGKSRHSVLGNARTQERGKKACQLANSTSQLAVLVVLGL